MNTQYETYSEHPTIIKSPGKFEGESIWAPYFWDLYLEGACDDDDGETVSFVITDADRKEFSELTKFTKYSFRVSDDGFVFGKTE